MRPMASWSAPSSLTLTAIAEDVRAFIAREVLFGQDDGLSMTTPLLELGILDSFALLHLAAHLNARYGIDLAPEKIAGQDFRTIDAIARLVVARLVADPQGADPQGAGRRHDGPSPAASPANPDGIVVFEAPACAQLFILFTGVGVANTPEFFTLAGLEQRNLIVLRDPQELSYRRGLSPALPTPAAICAWLEGWMAGRPHITEAYCIGVSSGGPMAMIGGQRLGVSRVWAFGPRTVRGNPSKEVAARMAAFLEDATGKTTATLLRGLTPEDRQHIDARITPAIVDAYYGGLVDPARVLDVEHLTDVVAELSHGGGSTEHRVYYVPLDACDARVVDALRLCPGVTVIALDPSDAPCPEWAFSPWVTQVDWLHRNHLIVNLLRARGALGALFPAFRPAAPARGAH